MLYVFCAAGDEMTSGRDLREQMNNPAVADAFSFLVSGKRDIKQLLSARLSLLDVLNAV